MIKRTYKVVINVGKDAPVEFPFRQMAPLRQVKKFTHLYKLTWRSDRVQSKRNSQTRRNVALVPDR